MAELHDEVLNVLRAGAAQDIIQRYAQFPLAATVALRTTGGSLTGGTAAHMSFNRVEGSFGQDAPVLLKDPALIAGGEVHGEILVAQTRGFYLAMSTIAALFATTANSYGDFWHTLNTATAASTRYGDTLMKPVTTGGSDFWRFTYWTAMFLEKGDQVRSSWVFFGGNATVDADGAGNIYPRFGLILLGTR